MVIEYPSPEFRSPDPPHCDICGKFTSDLTKGACARCYEAWRATPEPEDVGEWDCCDEHQTTFLKGNACELCIAESSRS